MPSSPRVRFAIDFRRAELQAKRQAGATARYKNSIKNLIPKLREQLQTAQMIGGFRYVVLEGSFSWGKFLSGYEEKTHKSLINIERIRLVYKNKADGTKISNLSQFRSQTSDGKIQTDYTLAPIRTALGMKQVCIENDGVNVILEGITDKFYLDAFKRLLDIKEDKQKIHFIPSSGADNIRHLISFVLGWGYNFKVVFDNKKEVQEVLQKNFFQNTDSKEYEQQILMLKENGIEDLFSVSDFDKLVLSNKTEDGKTDTFVREKDQSNSEVAKKSKKKEVLARLFLEKVKKSEITAADIDEATKTAFQSIFDWIAK